MVKVKFTSVATTIHMVVDLCGLVSVDSWTEGVKFSIF